MFKKFIFTVVKNLALNKRTRGPDLPYYCLNCTNFSKLILRKIIKITATRCHILKLKCTKLDFGWGSAPDLAGGAYCTSPDPLAGFKWPTSKGKGGQKRAGEGSQKGEREGRKRKGSEGIRERGKEGKENVDRPTTIFSLKFALVLGKVIYFRSSAFLKAQSNSINEKCIQTIDQI